jgi:isoleucyl-tRNA synthetase
LIVSQDLVESVLGASWTVQATFTGADMAGWTYQRPFDIVPWPGRGHFVVTEEYVTTDDGTGLVHEATVFGAPDLESVRRAGVELVNPIDTRGRFHEDLPLVGGLFFKDADEPIIADLRERGLLREEQPWRHSVGHCSRSGNRVEPLVSLQWFCDMQELAPPAIAAVREGRVRFVPKSRERIFFDWMEQIRPWCVSRQLWWGHQIPAWFCEGGHVNVAIGAPPSIGATMHVVGDAPSTSGTAI